MKCLLCDLEIKGSRGSLTWHLKKSHNGLGTLDYLKMFNLIPKCLCGKDLLYSPSNRNFNRTCGDKECLRKTLKTPEFREKISKSKIEYYKKYPEKHPTAILAKNGRFSWPEKVAIAIFDKLNIPYEHQYKIGRYFYDFKIGNLLIEIDGQYWHQNREADSIKNMLAINSGFGLIRLPAKHIDLRLFDIYGTVKLTDEEVLKVNKPEKPLVKKQSKCVVCSNYTGGCRKTYCSKCKPKRIFESKINITKDDLQFMVDTVPMTKIAKLLGCSDKTIRNKCDSLGLNIGSRLGHWSNRKRK